MESETWRNANNLAYKIEPLLLSNEGGTGLDMAIDQFKCYISSRDRVIQWSWEEGDGLGWGAIVAFSDKTSAGRDGILRLGVFQCSAQPLQPNRYIWTLRSDQLEVASPLDDRGQASYPRFEARYRIDPSDPRFGVLDYLRVDLTGDSFVAHDLSRSSLNQLPENLKGVDLRIPYERVASEILRASQLEDLVSAYEDSNETIRAGQNTPR